MHIPIIAPSTAIDCGQPSSPGVNGNVSASLMTFGNMATYNCDSGYVLRPDNSVRTCQADGMWSGMDPFCEGMILLQNFSLESINILCYKVTDFQPLSNSTCVALYTSLRLQPQHLLLNPCQV